MMTTVSGSFRDRVRQWRRRRGDVTELRMALELDDRMLRDIGLPREQIRAEIRGALRPARRR